MFYIPTNHNPVRWHRWFMGILDLYQKLKKKKCNVTHHGKSGRLENQNHHLSRNCKHQRKTIFSLKQTRRECSFLPPKRWGYDIHSPSAPTELCFRFEWARGQTRRHRENQQQCQDAQCSEIYVMCLFYMIHVSYLCNNSLRSWMSESWGILTSQNSAGKQISCRD